MRYSHLHLGQNLFLPPLRELLVPPLEYIPLKFVQLLIYQLIYPPQALHTLNLVHDLGLVYDYQAHLIDENSQLVLSVAFLYLLHNVNLLLKPHYFYLTCH